MPHELEPSQRLNLTEAPRDLPPGYIYPKTAANWGNTIIHPNAFMWKAHQIHWVNCFTVIWIQ